VRKYLFPFLALILAAGSLLTVVRAPDWMWAWKLTILAGEFGHWLVLLPLGLAVLNGFRPAREKRALTLALCTLALVCFLRPVFSARRIAERLPAEMNAAFGGGVSPGPAFDLRQLYGKNAAPPIEVTTEIFARPDGEELKLDFYAPVRAAAEKDPAAGPRRDAPCIVVIHGGGWDGGDRTQLAAWNYRWAARGYAVAAISYRLAPRWIWPAQRDDVLAAIAWLKAHAAQLGLDPARLVLLGRSAGGQLATAVGYGARDPSIRGVVALYSPHDMPFVWSVSRVDDALNSTKLMLQYFGGPPDGERRAQYLSASGQWLARNDSPPTLLVHGVLDTLSWDRHSERLAARLAELSVPHYYLRLPWATHGFDFNPDGPGGQLADYAIDRFLRVVTK
jgi:acetyl esterase/lipase